MDIVPFYIWLLAINIVCFLPMYLLNFRRQPNPFAFLTEKRFRNQNKIKLLYTKLHFTDPFRVNFDFSLVALLFVATGISNSFAMLFLSGVLAVTFIYLLYVSIMLFVFDRPPVFASDLSLIKSGLIIAKKQRWAIALILLLTIALISILSFWTVAGLFSNPPPNSILPAVIAALLLPPAVYHWQRYDYAYFHARTINSCSLHIIRNLLFGRRFKQLLSKDTHYFDQYNFFKDLALDSKPNFVFVCVESYGAICHKKQSLFAQLSPLLDQYHSSLSTQGFHLASTFSAAPIFSGGSWLSYTSFMYGMRIDDLQLYDGLFQVNDGFSAYESMFHVLSRNGYHNSLVCPMGGVDGNDINWASIDRCFHSDLNIDWQTLNYLGKTFPFFTQKHTYCAPDQYALNFGYEYSKTHLQGPFSLFYCTMNSHIPWNSPTDIAQDWRTLNSPATEIKSTVAESKNTDEKYYHAIRYQLDFILDFALNRAADDIVLVIFGDHQPPLISTPDMGLETPVHVITKSSSLHRYLLKRGFSPKLSLSDHQGSIKHEGFMSLFLKGCNEAFGAEPDASLPDIPDGVAIKEGTLG